jgi:zinc protease
MKRSTLLVALVALLAAPLAVRAADVPAPNNASSPVEGFTFVRTLGGISEYTLASNGLTVLLMPEHSAPVLTFMVTYRVGSRNEVTGTTGATHLLEHLMFKGTEKFNRAKGTGIDQLLERTGALYNATTWLDRTNYYENLGNEHLELAVEMEADRMRNLLLREDDRRPEMTVVRNEFERGENSPIQSLIKEIYHSAYVAHPYHHSTIGWRSDIEKVSIDKLREFYTTFYWPNNATVSVIGDFQPAQALGFIKKYYGAIPRSPQPIPEIYTEEPEQTGPRRITVKRSGQLGVVAIGHKIPAATHADYPALTILSAVLTDGKNSRLYRALTDKNLTTNVSTFVGFNHDATMHITFASLAPGATHEQVEKIAVEEIEKLKREGVTAVEVQAAIAKTLADAAFQRDGSFAIAGNLNECIAVGDWTTYYTIEEATKNITPDDVKRVANRYFNVDQSTTGWFVPIVPNEGGAPAAARMPGKASRTEAGAEFANEFPRADGPYYFRNPTGELAANAGTLSDDPTATGATVAPASAAPTAKIAPNVQRAKIAGVDVIAYKTGVKDVVTIRGSLPAGDAFSADRNPALATLVGMMLDKGTTTEDKFAITQKLESVGAALSFNVGTEMAEVSAKCLSKDMPLVIGLIAEQLRSPAFSAEEFEKVKKQYAGSLKRRLESTDFRAMDAFSRAAYPLGHPNRQPAPEELLAAVEKATLEDAKAFHAQYYGPAHMTLVAVGDVDVAKLKAEVAKSFAGWSGGAAVVRPAKATMTDAPKEQVVFMPDKTSVSIVLGQPTGLRYSDPDNQALRVATAILGSGFTGRLMANVRDKEGLTYGIGSSVANDTFTDGEWRISATFAPALLDKGIDSTKRQLAKWYNEGVTEEELARRKTNLVGSFKVGLATTDGLAASLLNAVHRGFDVSWLDEYPEKINALSAQQVNGAIKKYLNPDNMFLIKAGTVPGAASGAK